MPVHSDLGLVPSFVAVGLVAVVGLQNLLSVSINLDSSLVIPTPVFGQSCAMLDCWGIGSSQIRIFVEF